MYGMWGWFMLLKSENCSPVTFKINELSKFDRGYPSGACTKLHNRLWEEILGTDKNSDIMFTGVDVVKGEGGSKSIYQWLQDPVSYSELECMGGGS